MEKNVEVSEHILVCISPSPSNMKVIAEAHKMAEESDDVMRITANQVITLLDRDVVIYPRDASGNLGGATEYTPPHSLGSRDFADANETEIAEWVFTNRQAAGLQMDEFSTASAQYHAIFLNQHCYGVIEIRLNGTPPDAPASRSVQYSTHEMTLIWTLTPDLADHSSAIF